MKAQEMKAPLVVAIDGNFQVATTISFFYFLKNLRTLSLFLFLSVELIRYRNHTLHQM
ncbi:hypothetical protein Hanom_Chr02g00117111 [Helianthus anomalus]